MVLHLLPDPPAAAAEFFRVLVPGGRCVASVPSDSPGWEFIGEIFGRYFPQATGPMAVPFRPEFDLLATLAGAGFEIVGDEQVEVEFHFPDEDGWWEWGWGNGVRALVRGAAPRRPRRPEAGRLRGAGHPAHAGRDPLRPAGPPRRRDQAGRLTAYRRRPPMALRARSSRVAPERRQQHRPQAEFRDPLVAGGPGQRPADHRPRHADDDLRQTALLRPSRNQTRDPGRQQSDHDPRNNAHDRDPTPEAAGDGWRRR